MKQLIKKLYQLIPFKKQVFMVLKVFNLPQSLYQHLYFKGWIKVFTSKKDFFKIYHYGYQIENSIFWRGINGEWEKESLRLWGILSKKSQVIIDVGANTGVYALYSKSINKNAMVHAFEPVDRVYDKLIKNVKENNFDIYCNKVALSNYNGEAVIYDTDREHTYSVTVNKNLNLSNDKIIERKINVLRFDSYFSSNNIDKIDLMKIDTETHEVEVLEGMGALLEMYKPTMLIEILNDEIAIKIESIVKKCDYLFFNIDEINKPKMVNKLTKSKHFNFLLCSKAKAQELHLI